MAENYDQLSDKGILQSKTLGQYFADKKIHFDKIYVGPLRRHHQTMAEVETAYKAANLEWKTPIQLENLAEHQGTDILDLVLENLLKSDKYIQKEYAALQKDKENKRKYWLRMFTHTMQLYAKGEVTHPKVQPWSTFRTNVKNGIETIMSDCGSGMTVAAFTSGGTTAAALGHVLNMTDEGKVMSLNGIVKNTAMTEFLFSGGDITLKTFNETPHLEGEMITYV